MHWCPQETVLLTNALLWGSMLGGYVACMWREHRRKS